jgi:site-specific DNA recombinase
MRSGFVSAGPLRAVAQRARIVSPSEIRILGTKTELPRTLVAAAGVETAVTDVHSVIQSGPQRR